MKKVYIKPKLAVENFILSDYIAACSDNGTAVNLTSSLGCTNDADGAYDQTLEALYQNRDGSWSTFTSNLPCDSIPNPGVLDDICYHTSTGVVTIFTS